MGDRSLARVERGRMGFSQREKGVGWSKGLAGEGLLVKSGQGLREGWMGPGMEEGLAGPQFHHSWGYCPKVSKDLLEILSTPPTKFHISQ